MQIEIANFYVVGINYKKTDADRRSLFSIGETQHKKILEEAKQIGLNNLFVLSTCNRTELYGFCENVSILNELICKYTKGGKNLFDEMHYIKNDIKAVNHLFQVGAGLDSQILGDYEIVSQIKKAAKFSKNQQCLGGYFERMINAVLQASKEIKTTTSLSSGTVSVSFAAMKFIRDRFPIIKDKKIAIIGIGKIGKNTCKNLVEYLDTKNIVLVNRTTDKASDLAVEMGISFAPFEKLESVVKDAEILIVATNSENAVLTKRVLINMGQKLILDLSIPYNVEISSKDLPNIELVNVDQLSKIKDQNLNKRQAEIPKAVSIIEKYIIEFIEWYEERKFVPVLNAIKKQLELIHECSIFKNYTTNLYGNTINHDEEKVRKLVNGLAVKMKKQNQPGCYYLEALNEYIATS